jgi:integrase
MSFQQGHFYRAFGAWHLRYYCTRIVNGKRQRVQRSRRVCDASHSKSEARQLAAPFLDELNTEDSIKAVTPVEPDQTILKFWTETYEPYVAKHKRANTTHSYRVIWRKHLKAHFGDRELRAYQTPEATKFLSKLAETKGQRTVQHVRSLMSGIYSHAVAIGACKTNPISDCKILGDIIAPRKRSHYTLEQAENIMSALVDHVDAQLIFALSFFAGLRPGEINALDWTDFDTEFVHVRRAIGRGVVAEPKTEKSIRSVPLIAPVRIPLALWHAKRGNPASGWVFPNGDGQPINITKFVERVITSTAQSAGFKTLYAARRGFATILRQLTGDSTAGRDALGHTSTKTTEDHYEQTVPEAVQAGMRLLEAKATKAEG